MRSSQRTQCFVAAAVLTTAACVRGQDCDPQGHLDISPVVVNGQIYTGTFNLVIDPSNPVLVDVGTRVWGGEYQTVSGNRYFTDDPGYGAVAGSGLPPGSQVGLDVLDDLKYWDGNGPVSFGAVPNGERLRIYLGTQWRCVGTGTGFQSGFYMAVADNNGFIHVHPGYLLLGPDGPSNICSAIPPVNSPTPPTDGIYLLTLRLKDNSLNPPILPSDPLYIVFLNFPPGNSMGGCAHCTALNYVGAYLAHDRPRADLNFDRRVDQDDLTKFESCATGPNVPWTDPCCRSADIDGDGYIDGSDFALLQRCFSGPDVAADPGCAN